MTQDQAVQLASQVRSSYQVPDSYQFAAAGRCIIEIVAGHRPRGDKLPPPGPVVDRVAWLVTFTSELGLVEFAVDDQNGEILRFRRSRGAVLTGGGKQNVRI